MVISYKSPQMAQKHLGDTNRSSRNVSMDKSARKFYF